MKYSSLELILFAENIIGYPVSLEISRDKPGHWLRLKLTTREQSVTLSREYGILERDLEDSNFDMERVSFERLCYLLHDDLLRWRKTNNERS